MQKKTAVLVLGLAAALLFCGCRGPAAPTEPQEVRETVRLYYGDQGNEQLVSEEREIVYPQGEDRYRAALEALIEGPRTQGYRANIAPETRVYGTIRQDGALLANLSREFQQFGGSVAETVAVLSVVNTLTQFEGIERVKILVEGEELIGPSGEPRGFMERFDPDLSQAADEQTVILYFANPDATALLPEERVMAFALNASLAQRLQAILEELIRGPQSEGRAPTIPQEVRVLEVNFAEQLATVNFSAEMHTRHSGGAAGEAMTILSIVNTLTEFTAVRFVQMNVEGAPMNIEHVILDAPVQRNEAIIIREGQ
jgi:germination protein M